MEEYSKTLIGHLFSFRGKITRKNFWLSGIISVIILLLAYSIPVIIGFISTNVNSMPSTLEITSFFSLFIISTWIYLSIQVKRLCAIKKSRWLIIVSLVPIVNILMFLLLGIIGDKDED